MLEPEANSQKGDPQKPQKNDGPGKAKALSEKGTNAGPKDSQAQMVPLEARDARGAPGARGLSVWLALVIHFSSQNVGRSCLWFPAPSPPHLLTPS